MCCYLLFVKVNHVCTVSSWLSCVILGLMLQLMVKRRKKKLFLQLTNESMLDTSIYFLFNSIQCCFFFFYFFFLLITLPANICGNKQIYLHFSVGIFWILYIIDFCNIFILYLCLLFLCYNCKCVTLMSGILDVSINMISIKRFKEVFSRKTLTSLLRR